MRERIIEFLKAENKTSSQLADDIGVQPSGISHIISGRNKPSLDFILKMLERYKHLSTEWLLFGKGNMYEDKAMGYFSGKAICIKIRLCRNYSMLQCMKKLRRRMILQKRGILRMSQKNLKKIRILIH